MEIKNTKITPEEIKTIIKLYEEGNTIADIAKITNRSNGGIHNVLIRNNVTMRLPKRSKMIPQEEINELKRKYEEVGIPMKELAEERGVTISAISHLLKRRGN